jgi:hypothetical protein
MMRRMKFSHTGQSRGNCMEYRAQAEIKRNPGNLDRAKPIYRERRRYFFDARPQHVIVPSRLCDRRNPSSYRPMALCGTTLSGLQLVGFGIIREQVDHFFEKDN